MSGKSTLELGGVRRKFLEVMVDETTPLQKRAKTVATSASFGSGGFSVVGLAVGISLLVFALTATDAAQCEPMKTFVFTAGCTLVATALLSAVASALAVVVTACCGRGGSDGSGGSSCAGCVTWMNALCGLLGSCLGLFNLVWVVHGCIISFPVGLRVDYPGMSADCARLQHVGFVYCVFALVLALSTIAVVCCCGACCVLLCASIAKEGAGGASSTIFGDDVNGFGKAPASTATEYASVRTGPHTGGSKAA